MNAVKLLSMTDESLKEMKRSTHDDEILQQLKLSSRPDGHRTNTFYLLFSHHTSATGMS